MLQQLPSGGQLGRRQHKVTYVGDAGWTALPWQAQSAGVTTVACGVPGLAPTASRASVRYDAHTAMSLRDWPEPGWAKNPIRVPCAGRQQGDTLSASVRPQALR